MWHCIHPWLVLFHSFIFPYTCPKSLYLTNLTISRTFLSSLVLNQHFYRIFLGPNMLPSLIFPTFTMICSIFYFKYPSSSSFYFLNTFIFSFLFCAWSSCGAIHLLFLLLTVLYLLVKLSTFWFTCFIHCYCLRFSFSYLTAILIIPWLFLTLLIVISF